MSHTPIRKQSANDRHSTSSCACNQCRALYDQDTIRARTYARITRSERTSSIARAQRDWETNA